MKTTRCPEDIIAAHGWSIGYSRRTPTGHEIRIVRGRESMVVTGRTVADTLADAARYAAA